MKTNSRIKYVLAIVVLTLISGDINAQIIQGKITSQNGDDLEGVSIHQKNNTHKTVSNANGQYSIPISGNDPVLVFSFLGFQTQEIPIENRSIINVELIPKVLLNEVVVTALGIKRSERFLGYSVGKVSGKELNQGIQENVLNGLSGRVAGVTVNSTGGIGSSVSMIIRGANTLNGDNQPLFVVDGIPLANTLNNISLGGYENRVDFGNSVANINPDDIEEISILKGPSAAALYGSRAGNGVVLITTKSADKLKKMTVSVNSSIVFDKPYKYLKWQTKFGPGQFSAIPSEISGNPLTNPFEKLIEENVIGTFGAALDKGFQEVQWNSPIDENGNHVKTPLVSHPNNIENFVRVGVTTANGISVANNLKNYNYRLSYSNMINKGILPNTDLYRNSISLNTSILLSPKISVSNVINFSRNNSNNRPAGNRGTNPLQWAYYVSPHINILDLEDYWVSGQEGLQQKSQYKGIYNNPYFLAYEVNNSFVRDRVFGSIKVDYQISPQINIFGRYSLDKLNEIREMKIANSYTREPKGAYTLISLYNFEHNADFLATYTKSIKDVSLSVSLGGNYRYQQGTNLTNGSKASTGLIVPGVFNVQNISPSNLNFENTRLEKAIYSVYGLTNLSYKNMIYLDITARNDWSSTLPSAHRSYFYPSSSLSFVLNEFILMPKQIDLFKLRGGIAQVGNDANPYQLLSVLQNAGAWDGIPRLTTSGTLLIPDLKPEIVTSYENGIDLSLFENKLRFSMTYYKVNNKNQILRTNLPPSSGYSTKNVNAGLIQSKGWEVDFGGTPVSVKNLIWDINLNFTRNRTKILELSDELPYYTLWTDVKGGAWTYVGDEIGDIYDAQVVTVTDKTSPYFGYPILDRNGKWQSIDAVNTRNKIGNFNPKFILGMQSSLRYKGFSLNFTLDWRNGGDFVSQTYRFGEEDGRSDLFLNKLINPNGLAGDELRDYLIENQETMILINGNYFPLVGGPTAEYNGYPFNYGSYTLPYGGVFIPGVIATGYDENGNPTGYKENLGNKGTVTLPFSESTTWSFTRAFLYDASYVKLREVSIGFELPKRLTKKLKIENVNFSIFSRNIILWTAAKINIDPENAYQLESGLQGGGSQFKQGIERYNVTPWVIPVGFKLGLSI